MMYSIADDDKTVTTEFSVRYAETDAMGVVHHANYLVYFEEGRSHYMRVMGNDYANYEANGFQLPVTETGIRYVGSLKYGHRVRIRTCLMENKSRRLTFSYEVTNAEAGQILVTGFTQHVWTTTAGVVTRAPENWQHLYQQFLNNKGNNS